MESQPTYPASASNVIVSSIFPLRKHRPNKHIRPILTETVLLTKVPVVKNPTIKTEDQIKNLKRQSEARLLKNHRIMLSQQMRLADQTNMMLIANRIHKQQPIQSPFRTFNLRNTSLEQTAESAVSKLPQSIIQVSALPMTRYAKSLHSSRNIGDKGFQEPVRQKQPRIYTYAIYSLNNNQDVVRRVIAIRPHWKEIARGQGVPVFKWLAGDYSASYFKKFSSLGLKRMLNQFQGHPEITTKDGLIRNLQLYSQSRKKQLFTITPITFVFDFEDQYCQFYIRQFLSFFLKNSPNRKPVAPSSQASVANKNNAKVNSFIDKFHKYLSGSHSVLKKKQNPLSKPIMYPEYLSTEGGYVWLLKPTGLNRGRGIQIFDSIDTLQKLLLNYLQLFNSPATPTNKTQSNSLPATQAEPFVLRSCSFVIQKYIQRPLLINGRKFDIRVWVLVTHHMQIYFFKQGYLRLASEKYSMDINNYFIHLTNNAIQKYSPNYCSFQSGNQMSFSTFASFLNQQMGLEEHYFQDSILPKIKESSYAAIGCGRAKLNPYSRQNCFQIYGLDFILDESMRVWLIEVNNNPCIEESSQILQQYIPRMLDDAFKLTLDKVFPAPPPENSVGSLTPPLPPQTLVPNVQHRKSEFKVDGYSDVQNMWELLGKLSPNSDYKTSRSLLTLPSQSPAKTLVPVKLSQECPAQTSQNL